MEARAFFDLVIGALPPATAAWARAHRAALLPVVEEALGEVRRPEEIVAAKLPIGTIIKQKGAPLHLVVALLRMSTPHWLELKGVSPEGRPVFGVGRYSHDPRFHEGMGAVPPLPFRRIEVMHQGTGDVDEALAWWTAQHAQPASAAPAAASAPEPAVLPIPVPDALGLLPGDVFYTKKLGIPYPGKNVGTVGMDNRGRIWHLTDEMKQARMRVQSASYDLGQKLLAAIRIKTEQPTIVQLQEAMAKGAADLQEHWLYGENRPPGIGVELPDHLWPVEYVAAGSGRDEWQKHHPDMTYAPMGDGEMGLRHVLEEATSNGRRPYRIGVSHYEKVTQGSGSWMRPVWFLLSPPLKPPVDMIPRAERQKQTGSPQAAIIKAFRALGWREDSGGRYTYLTHPADHWRLQLRERSVHSGYREGGTGKWSEGHSQGTLKEFAQDSAGYAAHYHKLAEEKAVKVQEKRQAAVEVGAPAPVSEATGKPQAPKGKLLVYHTPEEGTVVRGVPRPAPPWMKEALHGAGLFGARSVRDLWYVPRSRGLAESPIDLEALGKALGQVTEAAETVAALETAPATAEEAPPPAPAAPFPSAEQALAAVKRVSSGAREQQAAAWMAGWYAGRAGDSYAASPVVDRKFWQAGWYAGRGDA